MMDSSCRRSFIWSDSRPSGIWNRKLPTPITVSSRAACDSAEAGAGGIDRKQRQAADLHRAEDEDRGRRRRHEEDVAHEMQFRLLVDVRALLAGDQDRDGRKQDDRGRRRAKGRGPSLPSSENSRGPLAKPSDQHGGIDAEHQPAPARRGGGVDPELDRMKSIVIAPWKTMRSGNQSQKFWM